VTIRRAAATPPPLNSKACRSGSIKRWAENPALSANNFAGKESGDDISRQDSPWSRHLHYSLREPK
jgi:hypothetical protein